MLTAQGLTLNDCVQNSVETRWYVDLEIAGEKLIVQPFYTGYGFTDVPSNLAWRNALIQYLPSIYDYGFTYFLNGNNLTITNMTCTPRNMNKSVKLNVCIDISISC
jgi:hypothetical protein